MPTLKCPASSSHHPTMSHQVNNCHKPTSCIPTSQSKLISRPSAYLSKPTSHNKYNTSLTRPSTCVHDNPTIARPSTTIYNNPTIPRPSYSPDEVINILVHLIAINSHPAVTEVRDTPSTETISELGPNSPAPSVSSKSSESS